MTEIPPGAVSNSGYLLINGSRGWKHQNQQFFLFRWLFIRIYTICLL